MRENRFENILAFMAAGVIGVSLLSILAILIASWLKFKLIAVVLALPLIGLPLGFVIIFTLLIISIVRKSRENR
jgi:hypothetical protein